MTDDTVQIDRDNIDATLPAEHDGSIVVTCSHSRCSSTTTIPTDLTAITGTYDVTDWSIHIIPRDGHLIIDNAMCHNHRIDKAIASLEHKQTETIKTIYRRSREAMRRTQES